MRVTRKKLAKIDRLIQKAIAMRHESRDVDYLALERENPDLMPLLGNRLQRLRRIEEAARLAAARPTSSPAARSDPGFLDEDLGMLRTSLDSYEVLERIHYGGQGVVYRAVQRSTKRDVAIKILIDGPLASARQRRRFAREVEFIGRLRHANIVTVYESGEVRGRPFFAMEYIDGFPIDEHVILQAATLREIVRIMRDVCLAVSAAHQCGVIHRDLKPANIMVDGAGVPHVLDFGLATELTPTSDGDDGVRVSHPGQIVGTLPYLSPEQARGDDLIDVRSDVYTLGLVLYELLTGRFPYPVHGQRNAVRENILKREPVPIREALAQDRPGGVTGAEGANDDLEKIIAKALRKEKELRYQSVAALADDLQRFLDGDAVEAKSHHTAYLLGKALRRFRVHLAVSAAFVLLLAGGLVVTTMQWRKSERLARAYQLGLSLGGFGKLAGLQRDAGRLDQAEETLKRLIEIAEIAPQSDLEIRLLTYDAHHKLAEFYYELGSTAKADPICETAVRLARALERNFPGDDQSLRRVGFAHVLRGRRSYEHGQWADALQAYSDAVKIRRVLIARHPEADVVQSELAFALEWQGACHRQLRQFEAAQACYLEAHAIYSRNVDREPDLADDRIGLARTEIRLASNCLSQPTTENRRRGEDWLTRAERRLLALRESDRAGNVAWDVDKLLRSVDDIRTWAQNMAAAP